MKGYQNNNQVGLYKALNMPVTKEKIEFQQYREKRRKQKVLKKKIVCASIVIGILLVIFLITFFFVQKHYKGTAEQIITQETHKGSDNTISDGEQQTIDNLRREKQDILLEYQRDKDDLTKLEGAMRKLQMEMQMRQQALREKELRVSDYDRMVEESEKTVQRIIETSQRLTNALNSESAQIKGRLKKQSQY